MFDVDIMQESNFLGTDLDFRITMIIYIIIIFVVLFDYHRTCIANNGKYNHLSVWWV